MIPTVPRCAVAIMAKVPIPGEVKTRLCPPLSYAEAANLYRCFLLDKIRQVEALEDVQGAIAFTPEDSKSYFDEVALPAFLLVPQIGGDLGTRLINTLGHLRALGYGTVMAVDSDSPTLPLEHLRLAFDLLNKPEIDIVVGPTEDGGYYLIGLHDVHPELFHDMPWSTPHVFQETVWRAEAKGLKVARLPPWYDVDTPEDLRRLQLSFQTAEGVTGQHTRRFLIEHRR